MPRPPPVKSRFSKVKKKKKKKKKLFNVSREETNEIDKAMRQYYQ